MLSRNLLSALLLLSAPMMLAQTPGAVPPPAQTTMPETGNGVDATTQQPAVPPPPATTVAPAQPEASPQPQTMQTQPQAAQPEQTSEPAAEAVPPHNADSSAKADRSGNSEAGPEAAADGDNDRVIRSDEIHNPVLWHDPGNIASLNLYYGQGGEKKMPTPPFTFLDEDMNGTNPKFNARDANGRKWKVKLGNEARPEVVASRLLWAVGYFANDDYVLGSAYVQNLHMKRAGGLAKDGHISDARFARKPHGEKKLGYWEWKQNPFVGTREFNGLRVMMAVMNSWDLKDVNNAVYKEKGSDRQIFLVSDVGATFATTDFSVNKSRSKGNAEQYAKSKFITHESRMEVSFATPSKPTALLLETAGVKTHEFAMRTGFQWIGQNIPRADAKWIGSLLGQLSHEQIVDAFRAGHFPPKDIDTYVRIVEARIAELQTL